MNRSDARHLLGVEENYTQASLHRAWRAFVLKYHPDRHGHLSDEEFQRAEAKTKKGNQAYAMLRLVSSVDTTTAAPSYRSGQAPNIETMLRHAARRVEQAQDSIETWSRQLTRTRTGLADGRRLLSDSDRCHSQFNRLSDAVAQLIDSRRSAILSSFDRLCLSRARLTILREPWRVSASSSDDELIAHFLLSDPQLLTQILVEVQEIHGQTVSQMKPLERRFERLTREFDSLRSRLKIQNRTLRASVSPFVDSAQKGRRQVDAAQVALAEVAGMLNRVVKETKENEVLLRSRRLQLKTLQSQFSGLQARQLEADAAQLVYQNIMKSQESLRNSGQRKAEETMSIQGILDQCLRDFVETIDSFPQEALGWLHQSIAKLATNGSEK